MLTNPNTLGLFDEHVREVCKIIHACGGLVYGDGANLNAIMGIVKLLQWEAQRAREERLAKQRQAEIDAERERQKRLKESLVVSPPK